MTQQIVPTGEATAILPVGRDKPVKVFGTEAIRQTFDETCLQQAVNSRLAPGVTDVVLNPDAHLGYGTPVGCVMVSPSHIYPGPVGVDIKCSMSLLQFDLPAEAIAERPARRALITAICDRTPTGAGRGQRHAKKSRVVETEVGRRTVVEGASKEVCESLGVPHQWAEHCEDSFHLGHNDSRDALASRLDFHVRGGRGQKLESKYSQLGSYGGGNHFGECEVVSVSKDPRAQATAEVFGLRDNAVAVLWDCGSGGFGHNLALGELKSLQGKFNDWKIPLPGDDRELVYAPLGSMEADAYLDDMALGANFATVNHLLINALVLEAFQEIFPGVGGQLVYFISHNIARKEIVDNKPCYVHRKGATRAFPAGHHALRGTRFADTGHPSLLPGDPSSGSAIMVAEAGAVESCYSVNHGSGRALGRRQGSDSWTRRPSTLKWIAMTF